jgi:hypothetical protein
MVANLEFWKVDTLVDPLDQSKALDLVVDLGTHLVERLAAKMVDS